MFKFTLNQEIPIKLINSLKEKIKELINQGVVEEVVYGDEVTRISPMQTVMKGEKMDQTEISNIKAITLK